MSTIKSSDEHLTLNADGSSKDIKFQANGVEKASISSSGAFTSTTIDATKLTGTIPNFTSTGIDDNADATAITIDSNENVGIGVTPESDWGSRNVLQFGLGASISGRTGSVDLEVSRNAKYTGNNPTSTGKYINADQACMYRQNGDHSFHVAPSGTADAAITWTEALTITNDGRGLSQFTAKAWVKIDGDSNPASIHDSHNVSSVTDNAVAQYTVNFSNNMANANYCAVAHAHAGAGTNDVSIVQMPVGSRAVGSVGCHIMAALNSATTFTNNQDCDTEILIFGD